MATQVSLSLLSGADNIVALPQQIAEATHGLLKEVFCLAGQKWISLHVVPSRGETLGLSSPASTTLHLPMELSYELQINPPWLQLGPVIGLAVALRHGDLNPQRLGQLSPYVQDYDSVQGLIYAFALDGFQPSQRTVRGFYFSPEAGWVEHDNLPYPTVVYRRIGLPRDLYQELVRELGPLIFNSCYFDKWEAWKRLSGYPDLRNNIPNTAILSAANVYCFLNQYGRVVLKPVDGSMAHGLVWVCQDTNTKGVQVQRCDGSVLATLYDEASLDKLLGELTQGRLYLVQQMVNLKHHEGRPADFRLIMQKTASTRWEMVTGVARFGRPGYYITNFRQGGWAEPLASALKRLWGKDEIICYQWEQDFRSFALKICRCLDSSGGLYADVGLDVALDSDDRLWLLEINKRHDHQLPLYAGDRLAYFQVKTNPVAYAAALGWNRQLIPQSLC